MSKRDYQPDDVFQINHNYYNKGLVGAFIIATEIESWGLKGYVQIITSKQECALVFFDITWPCLDYVGRASLKVKE